jgi:hypothetical protein
MPAIGLSVDVDPASDRSELEGEADQIFRLEVLPSGPGAEVESTVVDITRKKPEDERTTLTRFRSRVLFATVDLPARHANCAAGETHSA